MKIAHEIFECFSRQFKPEDFKWDYDLTIRFEVMLKLFSLILELEEDLKEKK